MVPPLLEKAAGYGARAIVASVVLIFFGLMTDMLIFDAASAMAPQWNLLFFITALTLGLLMYQFSNRSTEAGLTFFVLFIFARLLDIVVAVKASMIPGAVISAILILILSGFMGFGLFGMGRVNESGIVDETMTRPDGFSFLKLLGPFAVLLMLIIIATLLSVASGSEIIDITPIVQESD